VFRLLALLLFVPAAVAGSGANPAFAASDGGAPVTVAAGGAEEVAESRAASSSLRRRRRRLTLSRWLRPPARPAASPGSKRPAAPDRWSGFIGRLGPPLWRGPPVLLS
jgi:hypothetical protein